MTEPYRFYGPPRLFTADKWDLLRRFVEKDAQIDILLTVDLPSCSDQNYGDQLAAMQRELQLRLTKLIGPGVTVMSISRTGGLGAEVGFRITRP